MWDLSSLIRDRTHDLLHWQHSLNHWITRKFLNCLIFYLTAITSSAKAFLASLLSPADLALSCLSVSMGSPREIFC